MALTWIDVSSVDAAYDAAASACVRSLEQGRRPLVVVPAFDDVAPAQKALSRRGAAFGVGVGSYASWLDDLWELFGDGRSVIASAERLARCAELLQDSSVLMSSGGMARLLADVVAQALPQVRTASGEGLSVNELALIELARAYGESLETGCLVERCDAVCLLPVAAWETYDVLALGFDAGELTPHQALAFEKADARLFSNERRVACFGGKPRSPELGSLLAALYHPDHEAPVSATGALRFAFPSGKGAEPRMLVELAEGLCEQYSGQRVVLASTHPYGLFVDLVHEGSLAQMGFRYEGPVPFAQVDAGRLLLQMADAVGLWEGAPANVRAAADLVLNPLVGMKPGRAFSLAGKWRGNRLLTSEELASSLAQDLPKGLAPMVGAIRAGNVPEALVSLTKFVSSRTHLPKAYLALQLSVLAKARELALEAQGRKVGARLLLDLIEGLSAGVALKAEGASGCACVEVMSLEGAARLEPASCAALVVCEMNSSERPVRAEESALRTLLAKLGIPCESDALARVRRTFYDAASAVCETLVLERALHAGDAEPQYPATLFEEVVDCYRALEDVGGSLQPEELVEPYAVTRDLMSFVVRLSEADFVRAAVGGKGQKTAFVDELPPSGVVSEASSQLIVLPRSLERAKQPGLDLSPSAIESYLECPHRWFAQRRLSLDTPDEGFGGLERGTFVHDVLEAFYLRLKEGGHARVTAENVRDACALLDQVFDERLDRQFEKEPGRRYVFASRWEEERLAVIKRKLAAYVASEPAFLPGFAPSYFELNFGVAQTCPYAGHRLNGTIDRIDVDAKGNAVVIDYKTSLSKEFDAHEKEPDFSEGLPLPRKMQALVYAKVARDGVGFDLDGGPAIKKVVGALYVNPLTGEVRGAYDAHVLGPECIPGINASRAAVPFGRVSGFDEFLDEAERVLERRLAGLVAGDIRPNPYGRDVCSYCPSMLCERRLA